MSWRGGSGCSVVRRGEQGFVLYQPVEGGALGVGEVIEALGVEDGLALGGGEFAEAAEGAGNVAALVGGEIAELLHGAADLCALGGSEALHGFVALQQDLALGRIHGVELGEAVPHALLGLEGEIFEAGLGFEGFLLLLGCEVAVVVHPLGEVLAVGLGDGGLGRHGMREGLALDGRGGGVAGLLGSG